MTKLQKRYGWCEIFLFLSRVGERAALLSPCLFRMYNVTSNRHGPALDGGPSVVGEAASAPSVVAAPACKAATPSPVAGVLVVATPAKDLLHDQATIIDTIFTYRHSAVNTSFDFFLVLVALFTV